VLSTSGYAILALLARESLSGYDIAQWMKNAIDFFWKTQHSRIYPELAHLEELGYVTHRLIEQKQRPAKKLYTITEAGREVLKAWLVMPPMPAAERNELLLKTYSIWLTEPQQALAFYRRQLRWHSERLAIFAGIQQRIEEKGIPKPSDPRFGDYATVRVGVAYEREYVTWCRWMIEQFEQELQQQEK